MDGEIVMPTYRLKEDSLIELAKLAWQDYLHLQTPFEKFSPYYTNELAALNLSIIKDYEEKWNAISNDKQDILQALKRKNIVVCQHWQALKKYIQSAYPKRFQASKLKAAGSEFYFNAYRYQFDETTSLIQAATHFLDSFKLLLQLDENMPNTYPEMFTASAEDFLQCKESYLQRKQSDKNRKFERIKSLNNVNKNLMELFRDAKVIFINDKEKQSLFQFNRLSKK